MGFRTASPCLFANRRASASALWATVHNFATFTLVGNRSQRSSTRLQFPGTNVRTKTKDLLVEVMVKFLKNCNINSVFYLENTKIETKKRKSKNNFRDLKDLA
jgi:hypothetical protein